MLHLSMQSHKVGCINLIGTFFRTALREIIRGFCEMQMNHAVIQSAFSTEGPKPKKKLSDKKLDGGLDRSVRIELITEHAPNSNANKGVKYVTLANFNTKPFANREKKDRVRRSANIRFHTGFIFRGKTKKERERQRESENVVKEV